MKKVLGKINKNFWHKVKKFFRDLFKRNTKDITCERVDIAEEKKDFKKSIKEDIKLQTCKEDIIEEINKNPDLMYNMKYERLEQLSKLYDGKIEEVQQQILQLKKRLGA